MLVSLAIRDVVLIDRLQLTFPAGLCVLTGETGAGKSILLDALGLALGARADAALVRRHGDETADRATVTAEFAVRDDHPAFAIMNENGLDRPEQGDGLILRRTVNAEGRSRAFINDQAVSATALRDIGATLVEIEGQFASRGMLDEASHRATLDGFGALSPRLQKTATTHRAWKQAIADHDEACQALERARTEEAFLRHSCEELEALDPRPDEEQALADRRSLMMNGEKLSEAVANAIAALEDGDGIDVRLGAARRMIAEQTPRAAGRLDETAAALDRAAAELAEATASLARATTDFSDDPAELERVEERLFTLRATARKHRIEIDALPALRADFTERLALLDDSGSRVEALSRAVETTRAAYLAAAETLSAARRKAATRLDKAVARELPPLKLEKAKFVTLVEPAPETAWSAGGVDRVAFEVITNPGQPSGPLARIASGGELARFMLALKVALAETDAAPTLVFDEVDSGIGGATAAAVGDRLHRLGETAQILVVTHSPQVAARGVAHWRVIKGEDARHAVTTVDELGEADGREEIARMLAGASITDEARAAADSLIAGGRP